MKSPIVYRKVSKFKYQALASAETAWGAEAVQVIGKLVDKIR